MNLVILLGRLGAAPELKHPGGYARATFSVATDRRRRDDVGEWETVTQWTRVVAWNRLAENCAKYLVKGQRVYVEGRLEHRSWTDEETGERHFMSEVVATSVVFLDRPRAEDPE